ncbi:RecX family transcriptional regulator [Brevibacillus massiliensis]|jgi:regulatory protein|uniref:RecX family transcriptional regulator n=1 Tax=Brevibacillus massiliensis TaxID=1118054 RepID=UPI0002F7DEF6|nr:RecX family transcriptional regulator [Brevibacillus massiliensis]
MKSGQVTAIYQDKKNRHRYQVYIDDEFAFDVHEDILIKYHLLKGTYIDETVGREVLQAEECHKAYLLALRYLGMRPRTTYQLEQYLVQKGFSEEVASQTSSRCAAQGYLNDETFARQWVAERLRNNPRGKYALRMELKQKGLPHEMIGGALGEVKQEEELEAARKFAEKRLRHEVLPLDRSKEQKLLAALLRRGFTPATVQTLRRELREGRFSPE